MNRHKYCINEYRTIAKDQIKIFPQPSLCQMIYYVDNLSTTIKFYHSLLKNNGRLMIINEAGKFSVYRFLPFFLLVCAFL